MRSWFEATLPYWVVTITVSTVVLCQHLVDDGGEQSPPLLSDAIHIATKFSIPWAIGFAGIASVYFLWRPQSSKQMTFGFLIGLGMFIVTAFEHFPNRYAYVTFAKLRMGWLATSLCMLTAIPIPMGIRALGGSTIQGREDRGKPDKVRSPRGVAVWDLLFLVMCFAVFAAAARLAREDVRFDSRFHRDMILGAIPVAIATTLALHFAYLVESSRPLRSSLLVVACAFVILLSSMLQPMIVKNEFPIRFHPTFTPESYGMIVACLFIVQSASVILITGLLHLLGYRFVPRQRAGAELKS